MLNMRKIKNNWKNAILLILVSMSLLVKIHLGFDCDEQYAFSMMYRFSQGQKYLSDLFDPYQFSALLMTPLFYLCSLVSKQYMVLLFRFFSAVLYFLGSIPVYVFIKKESGDKQLAFFGFLLFFTLTPKSIISLEHSNLTALFLSYVLMDLFTYLKYGKLNTLFFSVKSVILAICYPTLTLLIFPVLIIFFAKKDYSRALKFLIACFLISLLFIVPPMIYSGGIKGLIRNVQLVLMDGSHQFSAIDRALVLLSDIKFAVKYLAVYLLCFGGLLVWKHFAPQSWIAGISNLLLFCTSFFLVGIIQVLFSIASPTAGYIRYVFLLIIAFIFSRKHENKELKQCLLILLIAIAIMFISSNNGIQATAGFCGFGVIAIILMNKSDRRGLSFFLIVAIACQCSYYLLSYHVSGGGPRSVFHSELVASKTAKGILTEQADESFFESCASQVLVSSSQNVMIGGSNPYSYLLVGGEVFSPTTTGTPVYGKQWKEYLQLRNLEDFDLIVDKNIQSTDDLLKIIGDNYNLELVSEDNNIGLICRLVI